MADAISTPRLSRRALVFLGIVSLHVGFVYVLNAGLAQQAVEQVFGPIETKMIEEVKDEEDKPPPPPPKIEATPPPFVPPPDIAIDLPVETSTTTAISATTQKPVAKPPPAAAIPRTSPKMNPKKPIGLPDYPAQSQRMGEEGLVKISACVEADGRITEVKIAESSGFPLLDKAAEKWTTRSSVRMLPATENGQPVRACTIIPYRFEIKKN